jgi:hypothetical protein
VVTPVLMEPSLQGFLLYVGVTPENPLPQAFGLGEGAGGGGLPPTGAAEKDKNLGIYFNTTPSP